MTRMSMLVLAGIVALLPLGAAAQTHTIRILEWGFFPQVTYVKAGETLRFENWTGRSHTVRAGSNNNNRWSVSLSAWTIRSVTVFSGMAINYESDVSNVKPAAINFNAPPAGARVP